MVVSDDRLAGFVARNRADGEPAFTVRPPGRRPLDYVTKFSYPLMPSSSGLGADARAVPTILAALEHARDTGRTTISNQTTLPGDLDLPAAQRPLAFELFVPVCRTELGQSASVAERRRQFVGWAAGAVPGRRLPQRRAPDHDPHHRGRAARRAGRPGQPGRQRARGLPGRRLLRPGDAAHLRGADLRAALRPPDRAHHREVGRLARTDSLTGVANRRAWDEELARAARSGEQLCLAPVDLDGFKAYNDRHGHPAGDRLLRAAAAAWQERLRKTDLLARYGGEEFAVLPPNCGLGDAMEIAERLRAAMPEGTCSIGGRHLGSPRGGVGPGRPGRPGPVRGQGGRPPTAAAPAWPRPRRRRGGPRADRRAVESPRWAAPM